MDIVVSAKKSRVVPEDFVDFKALETLKRFFLEKFPELQVKIDIPHKKIVLKEKRPSGQLLAFQTMLADADPQDLRGTSFRLRHSCFKKQIVIDFTSSLAEIVQQITSIYEKIYATPVPEENEDDSAMSVVREGLDTEIHDDSARGETVGSLTSAGLLVQERYQCGLRSEPVESTTGDLPPSSSDFRIDSLLIDLEKYFDEVKPDLNFELEINLSCFIKTLKGEIPIRIDSDADIVAIPDDQQKPLTAENLNKLKSIFHILLKIFRIISQYESVKLFSLKKSLLPVISKLKLILIDNKPDIPLRSKNYSEYIFGLVKDFLVPIKGDLNQEIKSQLKAASCLSIADPHGTLDLFVHSLYSMGLINREGHWIPKAVRSRDFGPENNIDLVVLGDMIDRGVLPYETYKYLKLLREEALAVGDNIQLLLGNHELMYLNKAPNKFGSFLAEEADLFVSELKEDILAGIIKISYAKKELGSFYSHAGCDARLLRSIGKSRLARDPEKLSVFFNRVLEEAVRTDDFSHPIFAVGKSRGGDDDFGGLVWFNFDKEHYMFSGATRFKKICGHVIHETGCKKVGNFYFIDTGLFSERKGLLSVFVQTSSADYALECPKPSAEPIFRELDLSSWFIRSLPPD